MMTRSGRLLACACCLLGGILDEGSAATPPFVVRNDETNWWLVSPEGRRFFSMGVDVIHRGLSSEKFDPENPGYAAWQHYDTPEAWADATVNRLKTWRFTTLGGWSDFKVLRQSAQQTLYLTPVLHIGSTAGAPWWDMWDPKNIRRMEDVARREILPLRDDPRLLGYYSDNELGWWNATLWKMSFEQLPSSGQRKRLIQLLQDTYKNDWSKLLQDFDAEGATDWRQLSRGGILYLKSGGNGIRVMRQFLGLLADRYYQLMRDIIRKYDSRALYLGDRYQSFYYPEVARASARYVDVSSSNMNANWNDGTSIRAYLDTLHQLTQKPIIVSEFYMAATENSTGNKNNYGVFPVVPTQYERAQAARGTLLELAALPYVVGASWFQFTDEPRHGREDGENFNFGLVDIHDRPYREVTGMFASLNMETLKADPRPPQEDQLIIPAAPQFPFTNFVVTRALKEWDRKRGYVNPTSQFPIGDLYACWNNETLFLGLYANDIVETAYYRSAVVPKSDRAQWIVRIDGREIVRARIGANREPLVSEPRVHIETLSGVNLNVRVIAALGIPITLLQSQPLKAGDKLALDCTFLTHCGAYRVEWKNTLTLVQ